MRKGAAHSSARVYDDSPGAKHPNDTNYTQEPPILKALLGPALPRGNVPKRYRKGLRRAVR